MSSTVNRYELLWTYNPVGAQPSYDTYWVKFSGDFTQASIDHTTLSSGNFDIAEITFIPSLMAANAATSPISEMEYLVNVETNYYKHDLDLVNSYLIDGLPIFRNGYDHSHLTFPPQTSARLLVGFG
jgi:hypothetical protein